MHGCIFWMRNCRIWRAPKSRNPQIKYWAQHMVIRISIRSPLPVQSIIGEELFCLGRIRRHNVSDFWMLIFMFGWEIGLLTCHEPPIYLCTRSALSWCASVSHFQRRMLSDTRPLKRQRWCTYIPVRVSAGGHCANSPVVSKCLRLVRPMPVRVCLSLSESLRQTSQSSELAVTPRVRVSWYEHNNKRHDTSLDVRVPCGSL